MTYFKPTGENGSLITRDFRLKIPVTCEIKRRSLLGSSFKPKLGIVSFSETGYGNFSLTLDRYSDISFTSPAPDPDALVYLGETLFFGVTLDAVSDLTLFLDRCWATPDVYPMNPIEFTFVKDGLVYKSWSQCFLLLLFFSSVFSFFFCGFIEEVGLDCLKLWPYNVQKTFSGRINNLPFSRLSPLMSFNFSLYFYLLSIFHNLLLILFSISSHHSDFYFFLHNISK